MYNKKYYLTHPKRLIEDVSDQIEWAYQRVVRGFDDRATWSVDIYLFNILPEILERLKKNKHSIPFWAIEATFGNPDAETISDDEMNKAEKYFNGVIDKMIEGFRAGYKLYNSDLKTYNEFGKWMKENHPDVEWSWSANSEYSKLYNLYGVLEKIQAEEKELKRKLDVALTLFTEYHDSLWD